MKRRGFLGALGAAIAGATLDPERALWVPGARVISVPRGSLLRVTKPQRFIVDGGPAYDPQLLAFHRDAYFLAWDGLFSAAGGHTLNFRVPRSRGIYQF